MGQNLGADISGQNCWRYNFGSDLLGAVGAEDGIVTKKMLFANGAAASELKK